MSGYLLLLLFFIFLFFCIFDRVKGVKILKKNIFLVSIIILIIIASLKNEETSWDTSNYIRAYNTIIPISQYKGVFFNNRYEIGFAIINSICKEFTNSPMLMFFIISLLSIGIYGILIWKYSPYPFLSLFIYFGFFYLNREIIIIRFGIACALMLLSMFQLSKNHIFKSFLWAIIAFLFHYSALTYVVVLIIWKTISNTNKIQYVEMTLIFLFAMTILGIQIFSIIEIIVRLKILPVFFQNILEAGINYINIQETRSFRVILLYVPIFYFFKKCRSDLVLKNLYFIFIIMMFFMFELTQSEEFARIYKMYMTIFILFLPMMLSRIKKQMHNVFYIYILSVVIYNFARVNFFPENGSIVVWR